MTPHETRVHWLGVIVVGALVLAFMAMTAKAPGSGVAFWAPVVGFTAGAGLQQFLFGPPGSPLIAVLLTFPLAAAINDVRLNPADPTAARILAALIAVYLVGTVLWGRRKLASISERFRQNGG